MAGAPRLITGLVIASLACLAAAPARGAPDVESLLAKLNDDSLAARDEATRALAIESEIPLRTIEAMLERPGLSPEQHARLLVAARDRFQRTPRAALGVRFATTPPPRVILHWQGRPVPLLHIYTGPRVVIDRVFANFPAGKTLQPGDEVTRVNGRTLAGTGFNPMRPHIISREPGESLELVILRHGQELSVRVDLGRYTDLPGPNNLSTGDLSQAWAVRSSAYPPGPAAALIMPELKRDEWSPKGRSFATAEFRRQYAAGAIRPTIVAAGQPRGPVLEGHDPMGNYTPVNIPGMNAQQVLIWNNAGDELAGNSAVLPVRPGVSVGNGPASLQQLREELDQLLIQREEADRSVLEAREKLDQAKPDDPQRGVLLLAHTQATRIANDLKRQIQIRTSQSDAVLDRRARVVP